MEFFQNHPDDLDGLVRTASEVFDNDNSNVLAGTDYSIQTVASTHFQDIAIRRCLVRLGQRFRGDHLVEIRGEVSEGCRFNPGQLLFHLPELIAKPELASWWKSGSIESFW